VFWALVTGCVLAVPVGWVLATLILLPWLLGLFFYMLFGLLVGAFVYRVGSPAIPIRRPTALALGVAVTLVIWCVSLVGEYYNVRGYSLYRYGEDGLAWYPVDGDAMRVVRDTFPKSSFMPEQVARMRAETRDAFLKELRTKYPPGGFIGFLRWSTRPDQPLQIPRVLVSSVEECKPKQHGTFWLVRLSLSLILLAGAVVSQTLGLAAVPRPAPETADTLPPSPPA